VSSFFSLHRPLSLSTTIPPPSPSGAFDNVFETKQERDPWENGNSAERRPEDVTYALKDLFESLDIASNGAQEEGLRFEVLQESHSNQEGVKHLDGAPRLKSLDEVVASFRPFEAPPPPQAFTEEFRVADKGVKKTLTKAQKKTYAATVFITESTSANGEKTWTAASSPVLRVPNPVEQQAFQTPPRYPFRERMRLREQDSLSRQRENMRRDPSAASKGKMLLISVKRQRKLKMKKHKYKKLMKRTRNLRRRQDRA
jgi:hypothetical protein